MIIKEHGTTSKIHITIKKMLIMKKLLLFFAIISYYNLYAQTSSKGYIIEIEGLSVYLDYNSSDVKNGDRLQVYSEPKVMFHPVTKEKIIKKGELLATLEITDAQSNYSIAGKIYPANALAQLRVGNKVLKIDKTQSADISKEGKSTVAIAAATINDVVGPGYFGTYVSDMLMAELLNCPKIKLIDRSLLNAQLDETDLKEAGYIRTDQAIMKGQISGVQYMIQVTMQKPDVTNITTGIPIQSIINVAGAVAQIAGAPSGLTEGLNIGSKVTSNVKTARLKSAVSITARVVDVQTGEVLFLCSGTGTSEGEGQAELEGGALGGMQINGGVEGFRQTVTGKAISLAYRKIGNSLRSYFEGTTSEKVINNNLLSDELTMRKGRVYQGVNKLSTADMKSIYETTPELYFSYLKEKKMLDISYWLMGFGAVACIGGITSAIIDEFEDNPIWQISLASVVPTSLFGLYFNIIGQKKLKYSIKCYNITKEKRSYLFPEYRIGLYPTGLALTLNF